MKKIVFANGTEIQIENVVNTNDILKISIKSSAPQSVLDVFRDNPVLTSVMRHYIGSDLMCGYCGFTNMKEMIFTPDVTESIDYTTENPNTPSGFEETYADLITVHMAKGENTISAISQQNSLANDVAELKNDMEAINSMLGGEDNA